MSTAMAQEHDQAKSPTKSESTRTPVRLYNLLKICLTSGRLLKRISVASAVVLGTVNLILTAINQFKVEDDEIRKRIQITCLVINFVSIGLAAITSLDWRTQQVQDLQFANQLERIAPRIWDRRIEDAGDYV